MSYSRLRKKRQWRGDGAMSVSTVSLIPSGSTSPYFSARTIS